jgi:hypothetical protein
MPRAMQAGRSAPGRDNQIVVKIGGCVSVWSIAAGTFGTAKPFYRREVFPEMTRIRSAAAIALFTISSAFAADPALLSLMPGDAKVVGGINVVTTATSPFGQFVLSQMKDGGETFRKFVATTGFDPRTQLTEVVFSGNPVSGQRGSAIVAARGSFNGPQIFAAAKAEGATTFQYNGVEVLRGKGGDGAIAVLGSDLAIAGDEEMVKRALDQRGGSVTLDPKIAAKANDVSSRFDAWLVSRAPVGSFAGAAPNPQAGAAMTSNAMQAIEQTSGGVRFGNIVQISGEAITRSDKDALALVDVIRFVTGMMQMHREKNPDIAKFATLLDSMEVKAEASTVQLSLSVPQTDIEQLMKSKRTSRRAAAR